MVQQNEEVNYQGRRGRVTNVMGEVPNQAVHVRFDDGSERVLMVSELESSSTGDSGKSLNEKQIGRGQSSGGRIEPPSMNRPHVDNTLPGSDKPKPTPYSGSGTSEYRKQQDATANVDDSGTITPQSEEPVIDLGPGTGDTGAGLKADGKDVDSNNRRILGTEEIITKIEPVTRKVVDRNGRKLEVGTTISLKARLIKFHGADKVEVLYPPYVIGSQIPIYDNERKRLELPSQDDPSKGNGSAYEGMMFSYKDGQVVDANGNEVKQPELEKQVKLEVPTKYVEKF